MNMGGETEPFRAELLQVVLSRDVERSEKKTSKEYLSMSASRQLRALTTSYRALSTRNVAQRCASPVRPTGFVGSQQQPRFGAVSSPVSPSSLQSRAFSASALARDEGACTFWSSFVVRNMW